MAVSRYSMELAGRTLTLETGRMAKQAGGAVLVTYGETVVLAAATSSEEPREGMQAFMEKRPPNWIPPDMQFDR